ncbi:MAG: chromosomal replication initiator protein DnaA, partial [Oscillospiraceae bacterium]|nr:chromosomal replication initiator protein DnaA [Oscillospiraceae bacterium]
GLIIAEVCRFYSLSEDILRSTQRNRNTSEARQVAMYLIRKNLNLSLPEIGREFGRDHTTVMHALSKVEQLLADPRSGLQDNLRDITANINSRL